MINHARTIKVNRSKPNNPTEHEQIDCFVYSDGYCDVYTIKGSNRVYLTYYSLEENDFIDEVLFFDSFTTTNPIETEEQFLTVCE